ncbi:MULTISPECIES: CotH kinase family protein [Catenuloplanes]|uniref:CBM2 domain-containing protein n=1 Tax=Catenuloplanes niger TaxID=587534 RepID=A0AAE3ZY94_9ACTN|nr:CotH kinase family protein [Catenuloplanes niger]MDR7327080.1 hypothetical protein [Catenuloplanes niger]
MSSWKRTVAALAVLVVALPNWGGPAAAEQAPVPASAPADDLRGDITFSVPSGTFTDPVTVALGTAAPNAQIRYTTDGSVPTATSTVYGGPLRLSATTQLRAQAFTGGTATGRTGTQLYVRRSADAAGNDLPLVLIDDYGKGKPGREYVDAAVMLFDPGTAGTTSLAAAPAVATRAGVHLRGQSSAMFDKAPYRVEFRGNDDDDADHPVLGMPADSDWVLRGPFPDKSLIREALVMELSAQLGLATPRHRFVELYFNVDSGPVAAADYQGVYLLEETIKNSKDRLDLKQLDPEDVTEPKITGGYIFSFEWLAAEEPTLPCTGPAATCWNFLEVRDPDPLAPEQRAWLTRHVQQFHDMLHGPNRADYPSWIDVDSWVDTVIINELSRDMDAYVRSTYFHKDRGGPIVAGPMWDHDLTFGVGGFANNTQTAGWQHQNLQIRQPQANDWFTVLAADPAFAERLRTRWRTLRTGVLSEASLTALIQRLTGPLTAGAARNFQKWPNLTAPVVGPFTTPTDPTWQGQVQTLRTWLRQRAAWLDSAAGWGGGTTTPPAGACTATYSTTGQWTGGFQAEVRVTAGDAPLRGWTVALTLADGQRIDQVWNGVLTTGGTGATVGNASWNGTVAAGASTTFGLTGTTSGATTAPSVTCTAT